jgi:hypothetical protein
VAFADNRTASLIAPLSLSFETATISSTSDNPSPGLNPGWHAVKVLFPEGNRTKTEPMQRGEKLFDFYNSCGRHGYDTLRSIVNAWVVDFPDEHREEMIARLQKGNNEQFSATVCELITHALLRRLGCEVLVHPSVKGSSNVPDFLAIQNGRVLAYVEVTSVNQPAQKRGEVSRESDVYIAIDKARLPPGCYLMLDFLQSGATSLPSRKALVSSIESWVAENVEAARKEPISKSFVSNDWEVELTLIVGKSTEPPKHAIGAFFAGAEWISPEDDLKKKLEEKASRYGTLDIPYLVVVGDGKGQVVGFDDITETLTEAMFGGEVFLVDQSGIKGVKRANNGFWRGASGARNQHVSGVLLFPDTGLWSLRSEHHQPTLAINPWAEYPLPEIFKRLPRFSLDGELWKHLPGTPMADVLELPNPWPPIEVEIKRA